MFDKKRSLKDPVEIEKFFKQLINDVNGSLNIDFIDGGFADELVKVDYNSPFFYLYWKDFSKEFDKLFQNESLTEREKLNIQPWEGLCYVYQIVVIKELCIFEIVKDYPIIAVNSSFIKKRKNIKRIKGKVFN